MRILIVSNLYPPDVLGGYELGCRQATDGLKQAGHEVTVLTTTPHMPVPPMTSVLRRLKFTNVYDEHVAATDPPAVKAANAVQAFGFSGHNVHTFMETVSEVDPDVVYFWNLIGVGGLGLIASAQMTGLPWVMHIMDRVPATLCGFAGVVPPAAGAAFAAGCRGRFLCCSRTVQSEIEQAGVPIGPFSRLVPNWVATTGSPGRTEYRRDGRLRIVSAGRLSPHKGTDIVINAAGHLKARGCENFSMDLYGSGDDTRYRILVQELGLDAHVRLCGSRPQSELDALLVDYDLFAFPTWAREPFAFAPLEAAAHGCVPVFPHACGNAEWMRDGIDCIKVDRTPEAFADVFEAAAKGTLDLPAIGREAGRVVRTEFHLDAVLPRIVAELEEAARCRPAAARSPADAHRATVLAEQVFQMLARNASAPEARPVPADLPVDYDFFSHMPSRGVKNTVLKPFRRAARKLMLPVFHKLRDLLATLGGNVRDHQRRISELEAELARQVRRTEAIATEQRAAQRTVARIKREQSKAGHEARSRIA